MNAGNLGLCILGAAAGYIGWILHDMNAPTPRSGVAPGSSLASVQTATVPVLVEFYADWCGPCRMVGPVVEELAGEVAGRAEVIRIDIDKHSAEASSHGVRAVPTFIAFKDGREIARQSGAIPKAKMLQLLGL